ncbi:MAG: DUF6498-containing protein [Gammaproteobacteria bacterium]|jgi:hypothetical protein
MGERHANRLLNRVSRFKGLGPLAPRLKVGLRLDTDQTGKDFFKLPFRRSLPLILVSGCFLAAFCLPYFSVGNLFAGSDDDSLFSLVAALFGLFWLLGWSVGVLVLLTLFLALSSGAETLQLRPGWLRIRVEVLRMGVGADFRAGQITNLRWLPAAQARAGDETGHRWRGDHLAFDYAGETVRVGSQLSEARAAEIINRLKKLLADSPPGEPSGESQQQADEKAARSDTVASLQAPSMVGWEAGLQATSTRMLVLANLIPLAGVLLANWSIGDIMLLFWAESAIIGLFNLLKMWVIGRWSILFLGPFFIGHFGGFMVGHLLFIYALFLSGPDGADPSTSQVVADFIALWPALLGLLISHGISFRLNFLGAREYLGTSVRQQMHAPYRRIIIMHLTIIFGGFLTMALDAPLLALVLLIALKILVDVKSHISEHRRSAGPSDREDSSSSRSAG